MPPTPGSHLSPLLLLAAAAAALNIPGATAAVQPRLPAILPGPQEMHLRLDRGSAAPNAACSGLQKNVVYAGKQLGNLTWDLPPGIDATTCCSAASSFARQRSKNSTKGIAWSSKLIGPSKKRPGQNTYLCVAFDYGNLTKSPVVNSTSGFTPPLPPFPPAPPACQTFSASRDACPQARCYWADGVGDFVPSAAASPPPKGCFSRPPIPCGNNTLGGADNSPLCVHLRVNSSDVSTITSGKLFNITVNKNASVLSYPPPSFDTDVYWSVGDGEFHHPPHLAPFQLCTQYEVTMVPANVGSGGAEENRQEGVVVCVTLDSTFDLQVATTKGLTYKGRWRSNSPFVAEVTISTK